MTRQTASRQTINLSQADDVAREYAQQHPELGAMEEFEFGPASLLYFFEHGSLTITPDLQVLMTMGSAD